jgi:hypothetical protein
MCLYKKHMVIDKDAFLEWQQQIIDEYYTEKHLNTDLFPKKNNPTVLKQNKTIIVLDFNKLSTSVDKKKKKELPPKHKISLFHIGNMKDDFVSFGYEDNTFSYPGLDFGGLTNYKQKMGTKNKFLPTYFTLEKSTDITRKIDTIYNVWKKYNNKTRLYGNMKLKLNTFLRSAITFLHASEYSQIFIRFVKLPEAHRVLVTPYDIKKLTGNYYERIFKNDTDFAKKSSGKDLFCVVEKEFVTTNINKYNLLNEYTTY